MMHVEAIVLGDECILYRTRLESATERPLDLHDQLCAEIARLQKENEMLREALHAMVEGYVDDNHVHMAGKFNPGCPACLAYAALAKKS